MVLLINVFYFIYRKEIIIYTIGCQKSFFKYLENPFLTIQRRNVSS